jgi:isocitrate/isopropylmalate dehydrogenase
VTRKPFVVGVLPGEGIGPEVIDGALAVLRAVTSACSTSITVVTGGEAVDAKTTAPDELRGSSIRDGQTRQIAKGDVVIVPHGVPHQFLEVTNPFLYYVVKVR